ncbi:MAG TPA: MmcQ/YjbR family DNA-binding protein [Micropepsaceae bacterium]|nr:MmcQ/YjbR family DNA-binding protein [Micropepsaceae bacterium]
MSAARFRKAALALEGAEEKSHMNHPDFRVGGRIFATLGPKEAYGVVLVTPEEQALLVESTPEAFRPLKGAWGAKGATEVILAKADATALRSALTMAWRARAKAAKPVAPEPRTKSARPRRSPSRSS